MNDTALTREALLDGIQTLSGRVESLNVLRRVWKILDREYTAAPIRADADSPAERRALHYYARNLDADELRAVLAFIHSRQSAGRAKNRP